MSRIPLAFCLAAAALLSALPASAADTLVVEGEEHCVVNVASWDRLNVREEPSTDSDVVTRLPYGECGVIVVGDVEEGWVPIEDGHFEGWVNARFISMVSPAMYCVSGVDDDDVLNLRAWPSPVSRVEVELDPHQCDIAFLPYAVGGWQKVRVDGYEGWVKAEFLSGQ
ncbi:MAG TPA: SH3 domain-containing protein [Devosia sp.]|jgi:SH3-like domain-containing protein|nr:SH3 domain-containing protein [Devosia sp.]